MSQINILIIRILYYCTGGAGKSKDLWNRVGDRKKMIADIICQWRSLDLDILLCPSFPFPAMPVEMAGRMQCKKNI